MDRDVLLPALSSTAALATGGQTVLEMWLV